MDVLLTHAYFIHEDEKEKKLMRPYPPLGLLYISSYLKQYDIEVDLFDSTFFSFDELKTHIVTTKPTSVAIYTNLMTKLNVIRLMNFIKSNESTKSIKIILGGPDVTYNYQKYLKAGADFIVIGEGEQTIHELITAISNQDTFEKIKGIAYKIDEEFIKNDARLKIKNIDELPFPDREGINLKLYLDAWKNHHGSNAVSISTQRGCPYTCKWCSTAVYGQSYRRRSPKLVADEVESIIRTYNPDSLWFVDDVFTVSHKWITGLHEEFIKRKIYIPFECITRAERLNKEILRKLSEMGCSKIWIGAESGSQKIIDEMDRRVDVNLVKEMMIETKKHGIESGTFIMVGYPTETIEDIYLTTKYLKQAQPNHFTITVAYPIVGTDLYNQVKEKIINKLDWQTSTDREIDFKRTYSRKFYDYAVRYVVNEVNSTSKKYNLKQKSIYKLKAKAAQLGMIMNK